MTVLACTLFFISGLGIGLIHKGIHIHVNKELPTPTEYNPSMVDMLPNDIKQYFHENNGQIKF
jgi:hypothetical protein